MADLTIIFIVTLPTPGDSPYAINPKPHGSTFFRHLRRNRVSAAKKIDAGPGDTASMRRPSWRK